MPATRTAGETRPRRIRRQGASTVGCAVSWDPRGKKTESGAIGQMPSDAHREKLTIHREPEPAGIKHQHEGFEQQGVADRPVPTTTRRQKYVRESEPHSVDGV